jgi:hypothetical protein
MSENENLTKSERVKAKFVEWSASSTSHDYQNLFRTNLWLVRIFWLVLLAGAIGLSSYLTIKSFMDYFEFKR